MGWWDKRGVREALGIVAMVLCVAGGASDARAQDNQLEVHGSIDLVANGNDDLLVLNMNIPGDSNFDRLRSRLFVEGGTGRTRAFVQLLMTENGGGSLRLYGAYLLHQLFESRNVFLEVGKIPIHDGVWAPNTYSNVNPLVSIPLAYFYRSSLRRRQMPADLDDLLAQRGRGQRDVGGPGGYEPALPILYDNCWDYGAYVIGSGTRYDYAIGATVGAPSAPVTGADTNGRPSLHARFGFAPTTGLRLHGSVARGPYLDDVVAPLLPAGKRARDYAQQLWIASLQWDYAYLSVKAEGFWNHWETPLRADGLANTSYYAMATYKFYPGWYGAVRYDTLRFEEVDSVDGSVNWDDNIQRVEVGVGYRMTRELLVKAVGQVTDAGGGWDHVLPAMQLAYWF